MATDRPMQLGMAGLGRMGSNFVRRLMADGHRCVMYDLGPAAVATIAGEGATGASTTDELVAAPEPSCAIPAMAPAGEPTEVVVRELSERLEPGDVVIDGGNTHYRGDLRLSRGLTQAGIL